MQKKTDARKKDKSKAGPCIFLVIYSFFMKHAIGQQHFCKDGRKFKEERVRNHLILI